MKFGMHVGCDPKSQVWNFLLIRPSVSKIRWVIF